MANDTIGQCDCPICKKAADVRVTKKSKAYIHCDDCGFQGFARGYTADKLLREMTTAKAQPPAEPLPMVNIVPKVTPATKPAEGANLDRDKPVEKPAEKPAAEKTIFDYLGL